MINPLRLEEKSKWLSLQQIKHSITLENNYYTYTKKQLLNVSKFLIYRINQILVSLHSVSNIIQIWQNWKYCQEQT